MNISTERFPHIQTLSCCDERKKKLSETTRISNQFKDTWLQWSKENQEPLLLEFHPLLITPNDKMYLITKKIGEGFDKRVFFGVDCKKVESVAIAFHHRLYNSSGNAQQEIIALQMQEKHPNIQKFYNQTVSLLQNLSITVSKHYKSGDLGLWIKSKALNENQKKKIMCDVIQGLMFLHEHEFIHRDVKPENILLKGNLRAVLIDFDLAVSTKAQKKRLTSEIRHRPAEIDLYSVVKERKNEIFYRPEYDVGSLGFTALRLFENLNIDQLPWEWAVKCGKIGEVYKSKVRFWIAHKNRLPKAIHQMLSPNAENRPLLKNALQVFSS